MVCPLNGPDAVIPLYPRVPFDPLYELTAYSRGTRNIVQAMQEGQTIKHEVYGMGVVTASDQERTAVDFDDHGPKLFVTSMMTAEILGETPKKPIKVKRRSKKAIARAKAASA